MASLEVFVDTSGWASLVDMNQPQHEAAARHYRSIRDQGKKAITTNYVITELVALLHSPLRLPRARIISIVDGIRTSPYVDVLHVDASLDEDAWLLLKKRTDKNWSLVDCASFVVMQHRGVTEALTTDHHFGQAGFVRLLRL
ncbi:MAG: type II toxin-antitoxin system VapC family toxin [Caldilineae bacterium]|nr:type II toxin-antitoxin system VapC family toxin [Caldilineae bacterium]